MAKVGLKDTLTLLAKGYSKKDIDSLADIDEQNEAQQQEAPAADPAPAAPDPVPEEDKKIDPEMVKQMEELQEEQDALEAELTDEKVLADYNLMNEKCLRINEIKELSNELFDEWAELSETLQ